MAEQKKTKILYAGQTYSVPATEGEKVISAMTSSAPVAVELALTAEQSLWLVVGAGIPVSVFEDRRPPMPGGTARIL